MAVVLRVLERGLCPLPTLAFITDAGLARRFVDQRRGRVAQTETIQRLLAGWILG
jgi:hypothetical protein